VKKKLDFVTNSSSTSFCGWGTTVYKFNELPEKVKENIYSGYVKYIKEEYQNTEIVSYEEFQSNPKRYDWVETLLDLLDDTHLSHNYTCELDIYIGITPTNKDIQDMTINQIKELAKKELSELGFDSGVYFIEVGWYDG